MEKSECKNCRNHFNSENERVCPACGAILCPTCAGMLGGLCPYCYTPLGFID